MLKLLAASALLCSCAVRPPPISHVSVDPGMDLESLGSIQAAAWEWNSAGLGLDLEVYQEPCSANSDVCIAEGVPVQDNPAGLVIGHTDPTASPKRITIDVTDGRASGFSETTTAAHELGHALWLQHSGNGTLMCALSECQARRVTDADGAQFREVWAQ